MCIMHSPLSLTSTPPAKPTTLTSFPNSPATSDISVAWKISRQTPSHMLEYTHSHKLRHPSLTSVPCQLCKAQDPAITWLVATPGSTSLKLEAMPNAMTESTILCDTSTGVARPVVLQDSAVWCSIRCTHYYTQALEPPSACSQPVLSGPTSRPT